MNKQIKKRDTVYHTRVYPLLGMYELDELKVRTVTDTYFVGIEKHTKKAFLFPYSAIGNIVFFDRSEALKKVKDMEKNKVEISNETYYEEY